MIDPNSVQPVQHTETVEAKASLSDAELIAAVFENYKEALEVTSRIAILPFPGEGDTMFERLASCARRIWKPEYDAPVFKVLMEKVGKPSWYGELIGPTEYGKSVGAKLQPKKIINLGW
jgi:hypothetical protein